ncbi:MAG: galactosyltransferase Lgt5 [Hyphomicrobiales bacterium]|nr:MAG: galactosyltransferase Lgt5 [Hyphomicrobiales bacterium]
MLHSYEPPADVPACIDVADAEDVLPRKAIGHLLGGRHFALASDLFRYEMLAHSLGVWVDTDCYCIRPVQDADYLFGWEDDKLINGAVLKLPSSSSFLADLRAIREGFIPPWAPLRKRIGWRLRPLYSDPKPLAEMPWGTAGPLALTHYAKHSGIAHLAQPVSRFYPVHWSRTKSLLDPAVRLQDLVAPDTVVLHLYNEVLRRTEAAPHPSSPLGAILAEGQPEPTP